MCPSTYNGICATIQSFIYALGMISAVGSAGFFIVSFGEKKFEQRLGWVISFTLAVVAVIIFMYV